MTDTLRDALGEIAAKNDLSGIPDEELESAARNALYECELIARAALTATPAEPQGTWSDGGKVWTPATYELDDERVLTSEITRLRKENSELASRLLAATPAADVEKDMGITDCHCPACGFDFFKKIAATPAEGSERYWEARWRDEKAENDRIRATPAVDLKAASKGRIERAKAIREEQQCSLQEAVRLERAEFLTAEIQSASSIEDLKTILLSIVNYRHKA